jgi:MFS family permease
MAHFKSRKNNYLFRKIFGDLDGNALDCALIEPLWAVFGGMITFYQPLYMKALGVSEVNMGLLNSLLAILMVITSFIAGPITDRMGRKRTSLVFDIITWTAAMLIWAVSQNFWFFFAAVVFNSFGKITYTSWTCLAIEDTPEDKRVQFFGLLMIINLGSGIFTPITGFFINKFGVVPAMRGIYIFGCISMTTMFFIRNYMVEETRVGKELMKLHSSISLKEKYRDYVNAIKYMFTNSLTLIVLLIMILTNFQLSFQFFNAVYLKDTLKLSAAMTSLYPGISAIVNLIVYFVFIPKLMKKASSNGLILGLALLTLGSVLFLVVKPGAYIVFLISIILTASGNILMNIFRDTLWNNVIGEGKELKFFQLVRV